MMAARKIFAVTTTHSDGTTDTATAFAWNSAARAGEAHVRARARRDGEMYSRGPTADLWRAGLYLGDVIGDSYAQTWHCDRSGNVATVRFERTR